MAIKPKDPTDVLDYYIDWSDWLNTDATISTSTWTLPSGLTESSNSNTTTKTKIIISGGTHGSSYCVKNKITTSDGLTKTKSFTLEVKNEC